MDIHYVRRKFHFDSLLAGHGERQGMCRMDDVRPQSLAWLLGMLVKFRDAGTMDGDLTKLSCEVGRALTFVSCTALATIHTRKMADNHSEVGGCQGVGSVTILTNERGRVPLLTAVLTAALGAGHLTDARSEDHLDAASVVTH